MTETLKSVDVGEVTITGENNTDQITPNDIPIINPQTPIDPEREVMCRRIAELENMVRDLTISKLTEVKNTNPVSAQPDNEKNGGNLMLDILPFMGGNLLPALREFYWDVNDKNEAERFIASLKNLASENKWSPFKTRMVLESKLGPKARSKYYQGLGNNNDLNIDDRLSEFLTLFSRKPTSIEAEELFLKCQQEKGETVISYKLRLIGLSEPYKIKFRDHKSIYDEFLMSQFKKGLIPALKMEVLKANESTFAKTVERATSVEECIRLCSSKSSQLCSVVEHEEINELKRTIYELTKKVGQNQTREKKTYAQAAGVQINCKHCNRSGHKTNDCWHKNDYVKNQCSYCKRDGHNSNNCWVNPNGKSYNKPFLENKKIDQTLTPSTSQGNGADATKNKHGSPYYCSHCDQYGHTNWTCASNYWSKTLGLGQDSEDDQISTKSVKINKINTISKKSFQNKNSGAANLKNSKVFCRKQPKRNIIPDIHNRKTFASHNMFNTLAELTDDAGLTCSDQSSKMADHNNIFYNKVSKYSQNKHKAYIRKNKIDTFYSRKNKIDTFYSSLNKTKDTSKPQVVLNYIKLFDKKPIIELEIFNRPIRALCDTGAECSVINEAIIKEYDPIRGYSKTTLSSFSGSSVDGYHTEVGLTLGNIKFCQVVCVAPIEGEGAFDMIIGFDFLQRHSAISDAVNRKIRFAVEEDNSKHFDELCSKANYSNLCNFVQKNTDQKEYQNLLSLLEVDKMNISEPEKSKFKKIVKTYQHILIEDVTKMTGANIEPYAPTFKSDTPIYQRQFRMPHSMANPLRKKLDKFEAAGIISRRASSLWNSPVLAVRKPDGVDVRMVLDLRKINEIIEPLPYPLMRIEDIISRLGGSKIFSNLDLNNGYYNVKLAESVKDRFSFTTPWGRYRMERLPQGCITSASIFQMVMNEALHDLIGQGKLFVFQDDIIVHSTTMEEHLEILDELFKVLSKINMATRPSKCVFFRDQVKFLGHIVGKDGSKPTNENILAIEKFERPRTVRQVRSFIGTINFYRKFIPNITELAAPLYQLIKKDHVKIQWTEDCEKAFLSLKKALISAPLLAYPDFTKPFLIKCDASNVGIAGVLEQETGGDVHPIAYCSRKLNKAERNYSVIEREALAIVFTLTQFRYLIYGYPVILKTDHKPLTYIFKLKDTNQRLVRWLLLIQDYLLQIEHIPGRLNFTADMLSRGDEEVEHAVIRVIGQANDALSNERIKNAQNQDPVCVNIIQGLINGDFPNNDYILDEGMVLLKLVFPKRSRGWKYRVVVPSSLQQEVISNYHDRIYSGHLSLPKVIWKVKQVFTWDTMFKDISNFIKSCDKCQRRNVHHTRAPFQPIAPPGYPMQRLNVDILGPFTTTKNLMKYLIIYTDSLSRFVIANPIPNMEASTVAEDYIKNVFCIHGGSQEILTDKGSQFMSAIFEQLCKRLGIRHVITSGYRPCSNGISERSNQKVINILAQTCNQNFTDWHLKIPFVTHAINTSPNRSSGESPFYLMHAFDSIDPVVEASYAYKCKYPNIPEFVERTATEIEMARAEVAEFLTAASIKNCADKNNGRRLREFTVGQQVLYLDSASYSGKNRKLKPRYKGPYRIIERLGIVNYRIRNLKNPTDTKTTHVDKLKIFFPRFVLGDVDRPMRHTTEREKSRKSTQELAQNAWKADYNFYLPLDNSFPTQELANNSNSQNDPLNDSLIHVALPAPSLDLGTLTAQNEPGVNDTPIELTNDCSQTSLQNSTVDNTTISNVVDPSTIPNDGNSDLDLQGGSTDITTEASVPLPCAPPLEQRVNSRYNLRSYIKPPEKLDL